MNNTPYNECPRYLQCNVNNCPLHPTYPDLYIDPEDVQKKCNMEKQVRYKIGSQYSDVLKYQGLTPSEWAGKQRFENMTEEERQIMRERGKNLQKVAVSAPT